MDEDKLKKEELPESQTHKEPKELIEDFGVRQESKEKLEDRELLAEKDLRKQIEEMQLDPKLKQQSKSHANDISSFSKKKKLDHLFQLAKDKGVIYAVHVAKNMDDPYLLDMFHDLLAREGYYKEFKN